MFPGIQGPENLHGRLRSDMRTTRYEISANLSVGSTECGQMENTKVWLDIVETPHPMASVLAPNRAPAFFGNEAENLLCGNCSQVLSDGASVSTIRDKHRHVPELIVRCPGCGTLNEISTELVQERAT